MLLENICTFQQAEKKLNLFFLSKTKKNYIKINLESGKEFFFQVISMVLKTKSKKIKVEKGLKLISKDCSECF